MPKLSPGLLETPKHDAPTAERSSPPPASPADSMVSFVLPPCPTSVEEIRRGNLSKLRRHLGRSVPPDLIPPKLELELELDRDEGSDSSSSSSSDEEQDDDGPASTPIRPAGLSQMDERPIKRWEKKGRRWVAEDYRHVLQCLRELR
ncbi:hypothetical protein BJV78DRAFT_1285827 [Lactifluus subvellereus]|nr:hypothetical protein BJV78DRAFT_1285827 [Lactifluus subvellereus]